MNWRLLYSKSFLGALLVAAAKVYLDHSPDSILEALGGLLSVFGLRNAISKNGDGK